MAPENPNPDTAKPEAAADAPTTEQSPTDAPSLPAHLKDVETIQSIARLIELSEEILWTGNDEGKPVQWAFRGQSQAFGTLVPSFQRQFTHQYRGAAEEIEHRLIKAFREHYSRVAVVGSDMPAPQRIAQGYDLRCLSVMQHYEIPTRLLDWTADFWTAVYFACASDPAQTAELWFYDREIFRRQRGGDTLFESLVDRSLNPPPEPNILGSPRDSNWLLELDFQITPRMDQQRAHHTVSSEVFSDHVQLIEILKQRHGYDKNTPILRRVLIDGSAKGKMLQYLAESRDMTASTIFPDVVGLGRFLRWQFESLRTMLM